MRRIAVLGVALAAVMTAVVVVYSGGTKSITSPQVFGAGIYQLVVSPARPGDNSRITQAQARSALNHPDQYSRYAQAPHLILFGLARATVNAISGSVGSAHAYADQVAWVGVYEVPAKALMINCETGRTKPPPTKPSDIYHFAIIIDPSAGTQTFWSENASRITLWVCSGRRL